VRILRLETGKHNILGLEAVLALQSEVEAAAQDDAVRCLAMRGRTDSFCAGLDSRVLASGGRDAGDLLLATGELLAALFGSALPVVVGCEGHAVAAGAMLLLVADLRVAVEGKYRVGFSEVSNGMALPELPILLARERIAPRFVHRVTSGGTLLDPAVAQEAGFVDHVVAPDAFEKAFSDAATTLAALDPDAYAKTAAVVRKPVLERMATLLAPMRAGLRERS
jgi:enoyl-CoA hydratase